VTSPFDACEHLGPEARAGETHRARGTGRDERTVDNHPTQVRGSGGKMHKQLMATLLAGSMAVAGVAMAQDAQKLAESSGCLKCHTVEKKKKGPAFKTSAAEYKKKGLSGDKAIAEMKDKHEADDLKNLKSDADLKTILNWVLSL
jgi:cytochrome c